MERIEQLYYKEISAYKRLSEEEEKVLFERMQAGDECARECLIGSYLRIVVLMARHPKYSSQEELMDLIQEGNMGLIQAIDSYDPASGSSFASFARICIRNRILSFIQQNNRVLLLLDTPVYEDSDEYVTRADQVADEASVMGDAAFVLAEEDLVLEERRVAVLQALEELSWREREVVEMLYGIGARKAMCIQEVSMLLGLTVQRIGQLRDEALEKLKGRF